MATGWRPSAGDYVTVRLHGDDRTGRYVIRGTSGDRLLVHEVWCEAGQLREGTRRREIRWADISDVRPTPAPEC